MKYFPKIIIIVFLAILFFQISTVEAACTDVLKTLMPTCETIGMVNSDFSKCTPLTACVSNNPNDCNCCCDKSTLTPTPTPTQTPTPTPASKGIQFVPQILTKDATGYSFNSADKTTGNIANLVRAIYNYAIGIVGILAAVVLMVGGVLWIVAGGNSSQVSEAKAWIGAALTGLVLALTSYLILTTVNPALVNLEKTNIPGVKEAPVATGCCITTTEATLGTYSRKEILETAVCVGKGGLWYKICPSTPCCSDKRGHCINTVGNRTEQGCKDAAVASSQIFNNYLPDGKCSSNVGEGCVAY